MKILAGIYKPDTGSIQIAGRPCEFAEPQQAIEAGISMIYQELDLAEHLTVAENVFLGHEPRGKLPFTIDLKAMADKTAELARRLNFDIDPAGIVKDLSTGDCQIVEVLKALMRNASIIVMDEPTSSLSEKGAQRLFEVVRELRQQGISIIYISHRLEEIMTLADDITVLRDGRVVQSDSAKKMDIPHIVRYMVGRELTDLFPGRNALCGDVCVQVQNLTSTQRVTDISFDIRAGEIVAMAGLVGAGRTEVAETIFGVTPKISGKIIIDGKEIIINRPADAINNGIALLTEDRKRTGLCLQLPCSWNITLPNLGGIDMAAIIKPDKENKIAAEIAGRIGIKWVGPEVPAESLSGGNQQKLLIARWLLAKSRFMIFDEPTRGIDVGAKKEVYAILNRLAEQGKAILFISSELPELFGIADRILVMRRGSLVGNFKTSETTQEEIMHFAAVDPVGKSATGTTKNRHGNNFSTGWRQLNGKADKTVAALRKFAAHCVYSRGTQA